MCLTEYDDFSVSTLKVRRSNYLTCDSESKEGLLKKNKDSLYVI